MNKKIILPIGAIAAIAAPIATAVSCGSDDPTNEVVDFTFSSEQSIMSLTKTTNDIKDVDMTQIIEGASDIQNVAKINNSTNKINLDIKFKDSRAKVDVQIKEGGAGKTVITVNKVIFLNNAGNEIKVNESGVKVSQFKKYVKTLVEKFVEVSKQNNLTKDQITRSILKMYGTDVGIEFKNIPTGTNSTSDWEGTWVQRETYERSYFITHKSSIINDKILNIGNPKWTFSSTDLDAALTSIESKFREFVISLDGDSEFDSLAKAEKLVSTTQSQITLGVFTSKGSAADDILVFAINSVDHNLINKLMDRAFVSSQMTLLTGNALNVWNLMYKYFSA